MVEQRRMNCGDQLNVKYINDFSSRKTFGFPVFPRRCELMQICEGAPGLALCYARPNRALEQVLNHPCVTIITNAGLNQSKKQNIRSFSN